MIYKFRMMTDSGINNWFLLTADSKRQLYRRIESSYGVKKENVVILEQWTEAEVDEVVNSRKKIIITTEDLSKKEVKGPSEKIRSKASELFEKSVRKPEKDRIDYNKRHNMTEIHIKSEKDLYDLIPEYKRIKVVWESAGRNKRRFFALVRKK